ncbi:glyoxalase [Jeotgalibacillus proteolyticus]|uniref:Glyoxalase n=2 Tax=Jeotgalibacillus proteolyticus TaxID=2082395 RepID=A0A2S5GE08_9BACL|nr:glyoxalase [Jeotgalibacillus proteolyticus]
MKAFYLEELGFSLNEQSETTFSVSAGSSELIFSKASGERKPFYHFAFNINAGHFKEAKKWIASKVELNKENGEDEVYFRAFDADSFYFEDPAGNIIEIIGRYSNSTKHIGAFSINQLLNVSEINVTTPDVSKAAEALREEGVLSEKKMIHPQELNFVGEGEAFILLGPPKRTWYFSDRKAEIHRTVIEVNNDKRIEVDDTGTVTVTEVRQPI